MIALLGFLAALAGLGYGGYFIATCIYESLTYDETLDPEPDEITINHRGNVSRTYNTWNDAKSAYIERHPYLPGEVENPSKYGIIDLETGEILKEA